MWRWLVCLILVALPVVGGCTNGFCLGRGRACVVSNGNWHAKQASEYLQGFMDGYNSAFPERGYSGDARSNLWHRPYSYGRYRAYRAGWDSGRRTGTKDECQRQ